MKVPDGWQKVRLGDVVALRSGGTPTRSNGSHWDGGVPWLSGKDLKSFFLSDAQEHLSEAAIRRAGGLLPKHTVVILVRGMMLLREIPIGITTREMTINQDLRAVIPRAELDPLFLAYSLSARRPQLLDLVDIAGHGTGRLAADRLRHLSIMLPPPAEQELIGRYLRRWDNALAGMYRLLEAKRNLKHGLAEQLLSGGRRLPLYASLEWNERRLGEVFSERIQMDCDRLPLLSITADRGVIPREEVDRKDTSAADKAAYLRIAPGDIGYNTMRMWQGVSGLSALEGIVSPAYTICTPGPEVDGRFASYLLKLPAVVHLFHRFSQGLVDDTLNLKFHHFAQIRLRFPPIEEQRAIAGILGALDREIVLLERQRELFELLRRAVTGKLLWGEVRVPSKGAAEPVPA